MGNVPTQPEDFVEIDDQTWCKEMITEKEHVEAKEQPPAVLEIPPTVEVPTSSEQELYRDKVIAMYEHYFAMFQGGLKGPTGNKSYEEYVQWRFWKGEYERLVDNK